MLRKCWQILSSVGLLLYIFLPHSSYAGAAAGFDGFDYPLGKPEGDGYGVECCGGLAWLGRYDYEGDGNREFHPGEDWNNDLTGRDFGSDKSDINDPVYAIGNGTLISAKYEKKSWGYVVLMEHELKNGYKYWSQYAHLSSISSVFLNKSGVAIKRGEVIGRVGDYENGSGRRYHLHFEIRKKFRPANAFVMDWSKEKVEEFYVNPSEFIKANRPLPPPTPQKLSVVAAGQGSADLAWDECPDTAFERYELYRSEVAGGTGEAASRELVKSATEAKTLGYKDSGLLAGQNYYYALATFYKDGRTAISDEVNVNIQREIINLSNKVGVQRFVGASEGKIYWEDMAREKTTFPEKRTFYYYDLADRTVKTIVIGDSMDNRIEGPLKPQIVGNWLCYSGKKSRYGDYEIFCRNLASDMPADIQISQGGGSNVDPQLSEEGILVWKGSGNGRLLWTNLNDGTTVNELTATTVLEPRIWGKNVIYKEKVTATTFNLWLANIETGSKSLLKTEVDSGFSDIWQDKVTYSRDSNIYLTSIGNPGSELLIAEKGQKNARIRDGKIVYSKLGADGKPHLYVYIISPQKTIDVSGPLKTMPVPVVFENLVAYDDAVSEAPIDMDIFLTFL